MRNRFLTLAAASLAFGAWAGPAVADEPVASQTAEQVAGSQQQSSSSATSTQVGPSNQNINVRVLSPGDNGSVTQSNESVAGSFAGNANETKQSVDQSQSGSGAGGTAIQEALQKAGSYQKAESNAESTQVKPKNQNISVRVLSPGDDGDVEQTNSSTALSGAVNANKTKQDVDQDQGDDHKGDGHPGDGMDRCGCGGDSTQIQAAGQEAFNKQKAESYAESTQIEPKNQNIGVRVLSPGDDGSVSQANESAAYSAALNLNKTDQDIDQSQSGSKGCGCHGGDATGIQAAGQAAYNDQKAESAAQSKQIHPSNGALSFRFKSYGGGGDLTQSNSSLAKSLAANWNELDQDVDQTQGGRKH